MAMLAPALFQKFVDANNLPLAGGKLYSYVAGTSTLLETYTDSSGTTPNANPIILNSDGGAQIWLGSNIYKFVLKDVNDVTIDTIDNVSFIAAGSIVAAMLANDSVTTPKILNGAVTNAKIGASAVGTSNLANSSVTTAKINNGAVTTAKLADGSITAAKLASLGQQISSTCTSFVTSSTTYADVTNLSVSITTTGRPIFLGLINDPAATGSLQVYNASVVVMNADLAFVRGSTVVSQQTLGHMATTTYAINFDLGIFHIDAPTAGTYTYKVQIRTNAASTVASLTYAKLIAYEI